MSEVPRRTKVVRVWDKSEKYWIDLEVLDQGHFSGWNWPGTDEGNESALGNDVFVIWGGSDRTDDNVFVIMTPKPEGSNYFDRKPTITLRAAFEVKFLRKANPGFIGPETLNRIFINQRLKVDSVTQRTSGNETRQAYRFRLASNNIDDEFLKDVKGFNGKQPPSDPKKYLNAVKESNDPAELWLDVLITDSFTQDKLSGFFAQRTVWERAWGNIVRMPGVKKSPDRRKPHLMLDPYQHVINFGPDSLAVEFYRGSGGRNQ